MDSATQTEEKTCEKKGCRVLFSKKDSRDFNNGATRNGNKKKRRKIAKRAGKKVSFVDNSNSFENDQQQSFWEDSRRPYFGRIYFGEFAGFGDFFGESGGNYFCVGDVGASFFGAPGG